MEINYAAFESPEEEPEALTKRLAKQLVEGKSREELLALAGLFARKNQEDDSVGDTATSPGAPSTPDELWDYIYDTWHVAIPRVAVCEDHDAPFDFVCAGFFDWYPNIFEISSRGAGKSFKRALGHALNARFKPGSESATFGAVEEQAKRVYNAFKTFINGGLPDDQSEIIGEPKISETRYKPVPGMPYGSVVEILGGTVAAVNGPHPQFPHSDEVELMRSDTWKESRNLASDKLTPDGRRIKGQNSATSTMKWKGGRVWQILQQFNDAKAKAIERYGDDKALVDEMITKTSPFYVFINCLFENASQVANCREVPENADLPEWEPGMDRDKCKCDCHEIVNGLLETQDEGGGLMPRTLASECEGRFYRSRGHRSRGEVIQLFLQNDARTWSAQQLCRETESEGLYIPSFSRNRHGLSKFAFDISNGSVYTGTDWGFTDEAAVLWIQYLERAVEAIRYDGRKIVLPRGARVAISERTVAQKTATELGNEAIMREVKLASVLSVSRVQVRKRWADLQGAGDRRDWAKMGLKTARYSTRDFGEHVKEFRGLVDADRFFVVVDEDRFSGVGCPVLCEQLEGWREEDGRESRELPQHVVSAARYVLYGMHDIYQDSGAQSPEQQEIQRLQKTTSAMPAARSIPRQTGSSSDYGGQAALRSETEWRARV
jgi:hypothetical protein